MTGPASSTQCFFCHRPTQMGGHNDGCPVLDPTGEAMAEWNRGYAYGFDDHHIDWWQFQDYSKAFVFGWRVGKATIDRMVEAAFYSNYGYELEYDEDSNII